MGHACIVIAYQAPTQYIKDKHTAKLLKLQKMYEIKSWPLGFFKNRGYKSKSLNKIGFK